MKRVEVGQRETSFVVQRILLGIAADIYETSILDDAELEFQKWKKYGAHGAHVLLVRKDTRVIYYHNPHND